MKLTIATAELARAFARIYGLTSKKSANPVHAYALLKADIDGHVTVSATDLEVGISGVYDADVDEAGQVALHGKQLYDITRAISTDLCELQTSDGAEVVLRAGRSKFKLLGVEPQTLPELPIVDRERPLEIPAKPLAKMIDRTVFCVSTDSSRENLRGVYVESPEPNVLRFIATDGHRLGLGEHSFADDISGAIESNSGVIVPLRAMVELRKILSDSSQPIETVCLGFSSRSGIIRAGGITMVTRLIDGQFPDYHQVIPKSGNSIARIDRQSLQSSLKRVSLVSQANSNVVHLHLTAGSLELRASDAQYGEATEQIEMEYAGEDIAIGFNARYMLDAINLIDDTAIELSLLDKLSPGVIRPLEEPGFLAVVMPIRL